MPVLKVEQSGPTEREKRILKWPNVVRAVLGETESKRSQIIELVCNIDDMTAEELSFAMDELFALGALTSTSPISGMKKSRPGVMLTLHVQRRKKEKDAALHLQKYTTLGRSGVCLQPV
mgnify:CR=1 FL=1